MSGNVLVVAQRSGSLSGLSLDRGTAQWTVEQPASVALAADDARVYAAHETELTARSGVTGEVTWRKTLEAPAAAPLLARAGWLLVADVSGALVAFRATDGELVWRQHLDGSPSDEPPTIAGETVVVSRTTGELFALAIPTGGLVWRVTLKGRPGTPLVTDGRIILGSTDNMLYCLDERTGRLVWRWRAGGDIRSAPVVDANHLYYVALDNVLRAIDRTSGNLRWKHGLSTRATTGLRLVSDQLLVSGLAPQIRAHRAMDGRPIGNLTVPTDLLAVPPLLVRRPAPDYVFCIVAGRDGALFAYRPTLSLPTSPLEALPGLPAELIPPDAVIAEGAEPR